MTRYFTSTHERIDIDGDVATVGITHHAVEQLGDVVFVEHPQINIQVMAGKPLSVVESTKAASEVYAPLSGIVIDVNNDIVDNPALVSDDTDESVWFFKLKLSNLDEVKNLLDATAYKASIG
jgi:glycine cleavage system H protein